MGVKIYVDWNGDGVATNYVAGDELNDLPTWLPNHTDYTTIRKEVSAESVDIIPIITPYGQDAFRFHMNATSPVTLRIFKSGASYDITTTNTRYYRVVFWYRLRAGAGGTFITPSLYTNNNTDFEIDASNLNATVDDWAQVSMTFQATSSDNLTLRLTKTGAGDIPFYVDITGLMVIESTTAITNPTGYNSGDALDAYDNLASDAFSVEWEGGGDPYVSNAGEKRATVILRNNHLASVGGARYSPDNTSSPLYGYMLPNRHFLIYWDNYMLYKGYLDTITPSPFMAGEQIAVLEASNLVSLLNKYKVLLSAYFDETADTIIADVLTGYSQRISDYAVDNGKLDTGLTTFVYYGDNSQQSDVAPPMPLSLWAILSELAEAERGKVFVDREGSVRFLNRHWAASASIALTLDNTAQGIQYTPAAISLINRVVVKCYPRVEGASGTALLWSLDKNRRVRPGRVRKWKAKYIDQATERYCGAKDVITPTGADYVTSGGSPVLTLTAGGEEAEIAIDNTAGATDALITTMNIRGRKIKSLNPLEELAEDEDSIANYGLREVYFDLKALDNANDAEDLAAWELALRSGVAGLVTAVTIMREANGTANLDQLTLEVGDIIRVIDDQLGIDDNYVIVGYTHAISAESMKVAHETTFLVERALSSSIWVLGVSALGTETVLGY